MIREREKKPGTDLPGLLDAYQSLGVPDELIAATWIVNRRSNLTPDRRPILTPLSGGF
jgi:hypothetical protein